MAEIGIDKTTGAPINVRAIVASFNKPEDKLKALKQYYPDAEATGNRCSNMSRSGSGIKFKITDSFKMDDKMWLKDYLHLR